MKGKLMIASDLHGSAYYTNLLMEAAGRERPDHILLLGDLLYHGPRNDLPRDYDPKQVVRMLNSLSEQILCVRGNCDSEVDQMVLAFPIMAPYILLYLDGHIVCATHGHLNREQNLPSLSRHAILLCGHTHVPACRPLSEEAQGMYLNPGSVSIPKEDSPHSYMVYEEDVFTWKTLEGEEYKRWMINTRC